MSEKVDHPSYYLREDKKECIEEIKEKYGDFITCIFCLTNAYKYLYRAGAKEGNSAEQDIAKAIWYVDYADKLDNAEPKEKFFDWFEKMRKGYNSLYADIHKEVTEYENNKTEF